VLAKYCSDKDIFPEENAKDFQKVTFNFHVAMCRGKMLRCPDNLPFIIFT